MRISALDLLRVAVDEARAPGNAGVVDEDVDARMALEDARRDRLDRGAVGYVARLRLATDLRSELLEPVGPAGEQHAEVAARRQAPRDLDAESRRGSGHHRNSHG